MYVVTACAPFAFQPRMWHFPVVGSFPYKGFFEKNKALAEAKKIKEEEGLEVSVRTAGGWSTLGWFKDPVLSNMLNRSEGDLANLIIHELTHGTLFVKDSRLSMKISLPLSVIKERYFLEENTEKGQQKRKPMPQNWRMKLFLKALCCALRNHWIHFIPLLHQKLIA